MNIFYLRVPTDRIGALIGINGEDKMKIETTGKVKLDIDSSSGDVEILFDNDPVLGLKARDVVQAIGRGFCPKHAMKLFNENIYFILIDIYDFARNKKSHVRRIKARVIGTEGKTKKFIEEETGTTLSVYGTTIGVIGTLEMVEIVKEALTLLLRGSEHSTIYRYVTRKVREAALYG